MTDTLLIPGVWLRRDLRALYVHSDTPLAVLSSAVVGGELAQTQHLLNVQVPGNYQCGDHVADVHDVARVLGITEPFVGMLTAAQLRRAQTVIERGEAAAVAVVMTMGISHPTAAGVTPAAIAVGTAGTINTIVIVDAQLTPAARVNAVITATEAKTLALVEAGVRAPHGGPASGTGTDAIVIASAERGAQFDYAGPISPVGALIARAVRRAMQNALALSRLTGLLANRQDW